MREILFRGKDADNGEWVYGYYSGPVGVCECHEICDINDVIGSMVDVDPETVGQYTGLTDKNGEKIYEGDVVEFEDTGEDGYEYAEGFDFRNRAVVVWGNGRWELDKFASDNSGVADDMMHDHDDFVSVFQYQSWIIGNIHDNPELIGGNKDAAD